MDRPFPQSFQVREGLLWAGCFPGDLDPGIREAKFAGILDCGIRRVINLMEESETGLGETPFESYQPRLEELAAGRGGEIECIRLPIRDASAPAPQAMCGILDRIDDSLERGIATYVHCWGGHGRTGTVVCCHLIRHGRTPFQAIETLLRMRSGLPKNHHPFEGGQEAFVSSWRTGQ